eukprot:COSAG02_NODE_8628_length_2501_cov_1.445462_3_plen_37_part_01
MPQLKLVIASVALKVPAIFPMLVCAFQTPSTQPRVAF